MERTFESCNRADRLRPGHRGEIDEMRRTAAIKHIPRCAHPGAEGRTMGSFLVMRIVMGFVGDRLRRGKPPDHKKTDNEESREQPSHHTLHHSLTQ